MKRILPAFGVLMTMVSCMETIIMDPQEELPAVVYCVLTNKSDVQTLELRAAESPSGVKPEVTAKEVVVTASTGARYTFESTDGSRWNARFRPDYGVDYVLRVLLSSDEELTAETTYPDSIAVNDYYVDRENPVNHSTVAYGDELFYADRLFSEKAYDWAPDNPAYWYQTRNWGFKLLDRDDKTPGVHNDVRRFLEAPKGMMALWEEHPYQMNCFLWVTARSPQKPQEFPMDALYVPGHSYRSIYLATDMAGVDNFNVLQRSLGDLACYSVDNVERIEHALMEREKELVPSFYSIWAEKGWYGYGNSLIFNYTQFVSEYANLPLHMNFLRLVYPSGGYRNQYSLSNPVQRYDQNGDAIWESSIYDHHETSPSPFTFQLFADINLDDPYTWQWTTHNIATGWVVFEFHNVSEEYDAFLRTLYKSGYSDVFGDLTENLYSREGVYSNIQGGTGIFGAECVTVSLR